MPRELTLSGEWDSLIKSMDPASFKRRLAENVARANVRIGREFRRTAQGMIRSGVYAPNSPMTVILKGSSKPLVDKGDLFQGISFELDGPYRVRLGVLKRAVGQQVVNVGLVLHEGATIDVSAHPQVRRKVWAMIRKAVGAERLASLNPKSRKAVKAAAADLGIRATGRQRRGMFAALRAKGVLRASTGGTGRQVWVIPARPFLARPAMDPAFHKVILQHYSDAIRATFKG